MENNAIKIFENRKIRTVWDKNKEKWYFSVVDVVGVLTESVDERKYRNKLKQRLRKEGNQLVTNCHQLKLTAIDGKKYLTDVADMEQLFRLIQSIPSPKAEPFKLWIAEVAKNRVDQIYDPELSIKQAMTDYKNLGYSNNWINQRLKSMEVRKELTDEWITGGIEPCRKTYKLYKSLLEDVNNDGIQDGLVVIDKDFDCFLPNEDTQILYYVIGGNDINIISYELVSYLKSGYNEYGSRNRIDVNDIRFENGIVYLTISIDNTNTINPPPKENIQIDLTKKNTISNLIKDLKNIQIDSTKKSIN